MIRGFCGDCFHCVGGEWANDLESGCIPIPAELAFCMRGLVFCGPTISNEGLFRYRLSLLRSRSRLRVVTQMQNRKQNETVRKHGENTEKTLIKY